MPNKTSEVTSPKKLRFAAFLAVMGPGVIAGLSDDDPAGITTYSTLGADYGYRLLWTLLISTLARSRLLQFFYSFSYPLIIQK